MGLARTKGFIKNSLPRHWVEVINIARGKRAARAIGPKGLSIRRR